MSTKLYVGNLDYGVTGDQLGELFAQAGTVVSAVVITDRYSGRSKGFGFVEMSSDDEAKKAIEMLNNKDLQGRSVIVNEARPKREDSRSSGGFGSAPPVQSTQSAQPIQADEPVGAVEEDKPTE